MYLQNFAHRKNADRREAITAEKYWNPLKAQNHCAIFKHMVDKVIISARQKEVNDLLAAEEAKNSGVEASVFRETDGPTCTIPISSWPNLLLAFLDIYEAAGVIRKQLKYQGAHAFRAFYETLFTPGAPQALEKIKMLVTGQFMGVPIIMDAIPGKPKPDAAVAWKPNRSHFAKVRFELNFW